MPFRWNEWNLEHATRHGIGAEEAEMVVAAARAPYPEARSDDKWAVWGRGFSGRLVQVVYIVDPDSDRTIYIIHARPLTDAEKRRHRRRLR